MKNFQIKSIILGLGLGAILTSIIGMIFMAGFNQLTNQEIIEKAKSLGMVEAKTILDDVVSDTKIEGDVTENTGTINKEDNKNEASNIQKPSPTPRPTTAPTIVPTILPVNKAEKVTFNVVRGDTSERVADKLISVKLITNKKAFIDELTKMGLTSEINIGSYEIKMGTGIHEIIKSLTTVH